MADDSNAKRQKLLELANRRRQELEEANTLEEAAKTSAAALPVDFGDDSDEELGDLDGAQPPEEERAPAEGFAPIDFGEEDEDEADLAPTAADRDFIDDADVAPKDRVDFGEGDEGALTFDEAQEAAEDMEDELDRILGKRRKEETGQEAANRTTVENLLAQMEVALDEDDKARQRGRPAVHKLRLLSRVQEVLSMRKLHSDLLDAGLLGILKGWIEPMEDGTLPNSKVRGTVLSLLTRLPIDCSFEDRREQLKRSELGKVVMFLSKFPGETMENRRIAQQLVESWSRPILAKRAAAVDDVELERILEARQKRQRAAQEHMTGDVEDQDGDGMGTSARPGQPGFRFHAAIPEAAALDYVKRPESKVVMVEKRQGIKGSEHKLTKKLKTMGKNAAGRAANVSVEGRNVTLQH